MVSIGEEEFGTLQALLELSLAGITAFRYYGQRCERHRQRYHPGVVNVSEYVLIYARTEIRGQHTSMQRGSVMQDTAPHRESKADHNKWNSVRYWTASLTISVVREHRFVLRLGDDYESSLRHSSTTCRRWYANQ